MHSTWEAPCARYRSSSCVCWSIRQSRRCCAGALQPLPDGPARPFSGEQMLLVLLHRSAALAAVVPGGAEIAIDAENGDN